MSWFRWTGFIYDGYCFMLIETILMYHYWYFAVNLNRKILSKKLQNNQCSSSIP